MCECQCAPDDPCFCPFEQAPPGYKLRLDAVYVEQVRALGLPRYPLEAVRDDL